MRLINADELKEFVKEKCSYCTSFINEENVLSWIDKAPTIGEVDECPQNDTNIGTTKKCDKCFYKSAIKNFELFGEAEPSEFTDQNVADVPSGDLISRQDAIDVIHQASTQKKNNYHGFTEKGLIEYINALPSADRPSGEWVLKTKEHNGDDGQYTIYWNECDKCGTRPPKDQFEREWHSPYCPSCGAKMKGGAE